MLTPERTSRYPPNNILGFRPSCRRESRPSPQDEPGYPSAGFSARIGPQDGLHECRFDDTAHHLRSPTASIRASLHSGQARSSTNVSKSLCRSRISSSSLALNRHRSEQYNLSLRPRPLFREHPGRAQGRSWSFFPFAPCLYACTRGPRLLWDSRPLAGPFPGRFIPASP